MAASSSKANEGPPSSNYPVPSSYDIFLSFRGEDTRRTFSDHLYTALIEAGLRTFRDGDDLERGGNIRSQLQKAIRESRSSIIVFSKHYASSVWCLDELVTIIESKRMNPKHMILPVFYDVDPREVRQQTGPFAEAFDKYAAQIEAETDDRRKLQQKVKVKLWRTALKDVADLSGMPLSSYKDGHEARFIRKIVREMKYKLDSKVMAVASHLIGMAYRVRKIDMWLREDLPSVHIFVVYGIGGIGKSTIAKSVYNSNSQEFESSSFLSNIRDISGNNGLLGLQKQLLADISKDDKKEVYTIDQATLEIAKVIRCKKVFVVLDDVNEASQFETLLGTQEFHMGSKILITTRNKWLLKAFAVRYKLDEVVELDEDESLKLFSQWAFGKDHPAEAYLEESKMAVHRCGGHPLALQVLGSSLAGSSLKIWQSSLQKLESIQDSNIHKILLISYESLQDDHDKNLFLHITCFFVGSDKDHTIKILDECDFFTIVGIQTLIDKCLIKIEKNEIVMHQLLQEMGREIIRQESPNYPGRRSRLWHHKDSFHVLQEKMGTESIQGLVLDMHMLKENKFLKTSYADRSIKHWYENLTGEHSLSNWMTRLEASNEELEVDALVRMKELKLLQLNYVKLIGNYKNFPRKLRWLCWHGFPLRSIPVDLPLKNLVVLDMCYSKLAEVRTGIKLPESLRILNLSHSKALVRTPHFGSVPNLEKLILKGCTNLAEVCDSLAMAAKLVLLDVEDCKCLRKLPRMKSFVGTLDLSGCLNLGLFIDIDQLGVRYWFGNISGANGSVKKPFWGSLVRNLRKLYLANCSLNEYSFPSDFFCLSSLEELDLSKNSFHVLPNCVLTLRLLRMLNLSACPRLRLIEALPASLDTLWVIDCGSLERIIGIQDLLYLYSNGCKMLFEVEECFLLVPITDDIIFQSYLVLGLEKVDFGSTTVMLYDDISTSINERPVQVLHEFGIISTSIPLKKVPQMCGMYTDRWIDGSSITLNVPGKRTDTFYLTLCFTYAVCPSAHVPGEFRHEGFSPNPLLIRISNRTKDLNWIYTPTFFGLPDYDQNMVFFSIWPFKKQLDGGDEIDVSVTVAEKYLVEECGIRLLPCYDANDSGHNVQTCKSTVQLSDWHIRGKTYIFGSQNLVRGLLYENPNDIRNHWIWKMCTNYTEMRDVEVLDWLGLHLQWHFEEEIISEMMPLPSDIQIFVKNGSGKTITLFVCLYDTVRVVKQRIYHKTGVPVCLQRLNFAGKSLNDFRDLDSYGIQKANTLHLVFIKETTSVQRRILYRSNELELDFQLSTNSTNFSRLKRMIEKKTEKSVRNLMLSTYKKVKE